MPLDEKAIEAAAALSDAEDALDESAGSAKPPSVIEFHGLSLEVRPIDGWALIKLQVARRQGDAGLMLLTLLGDEQTSEVIDLPDMGDADVGQLIDAALIAAGVGKG